MKAMVHINLATRQKHLKKNPVTQENLIATQVQKVNFVLLNLLMRK